MAAAALTGVNLLMLTTLAVVWIRNYRTFRSNLILGLIAFAAVLFVENAVALYFYFSTSMLYASGVEDIVAVMRILQFVAIAFLTWVTMQ